MTRTRATRREPALPEMLEEYPVPFTVVYELASLVLDRFRQRLNHSCQRCPS